MPSQEQFSANELTAVLRQGVDTWQLPGRRLHEVMDRLREQAPVVPVQFRNMPAWLITRHAALEAVFKDAENFPPHLVYQLGIEPVIGQTFQSMEGVQHRLFRKLATPTFRPRVVERMDETLLADVADELLEGFIGEGQSDLVAQFTERYPYIVIARLLGIPRAEEDQFARWVVGILQFSWQPEQALRCRDELWAYLAPVLEERRRSPQDDVISQLLHDELDGMRMSDEQVLAHIGLMFTAGSSTTHDSLGNLLSGLLSGAGLWQRIREDAGLRDNAIEEALRWEPAVSILPRLSRLDAATEFGGVELPAGSFVLMGICAANHDPQVFSEPHAFDIHRDSSRKITFGHGARTCPGMHLARRELRVTLDILLERLPNLQLTQSASAQPCGTIFRHPRALHCQF